MVFVIAASSLLQIVLIVVGIVFLGLSIAVWRIVAEELHGIDTYWVWSGTLLGLFVDAIGIFLILFGAGLIVLR